MVLHQETLCEAIKKRLVVSLLYRDDWRDRTYSPYVVYYTRKRNILVGGYQVHNPEEPMEDNKWRELDLDLLRSVSITDKAYIVEASFTPLNQRFGAGIICHVLQHLH